MTGLNDRERAFENKYAHDAEKKFIIEIKRAKLVALWAAQKLGKASNEIDNYVNEVVSADMEEAGHDDLKRKIQKDFEKKDIAFDEAEFNQIMNEKLHEVEKEYL
jgi:hypothetical protein